MLQDATILVGIETGLLKGLETLRWAIEFLERFSEIVAVSTVVQCNENETRSRLHVVLKLSTNRNCEQVIRELQQIEKEYEENLQVIESLRCFLMAYDQMVSITPTVTLPHPVMVSNAAWLYCATEVWRAYQHPVLNQSLERLLADAKVTNVEFFSQGKTIIGKTYF